MFLYFEKPTKVVVGKMFFLKRQHEKVVHILHIFSPPHVWFISAQRETAVKRV